MSEGNECIEGAGAREKRATGGASACNSECVISESRVNQSRYHRDVSCGRCYEKRAALLAAHRLAIDRFHVYMAQVCIVLTLSVMQCVGVAICICTRSAVSDGVDAWRRANGQARLVHAHKMVAELL